MHQRFEKLIARKKQRMEKLERDLILKKIENDPDEYFASHKPQINEKSKVIHQKKQGAMDVVKR